MGKQNRQFYRKTQLQTLKGKPAKKVKKKWKLITIINQLYKKEILEKELRRTPVYHLFDLFNKKANITKELHRVLTHLCKQRCQKMILDERLMMGIVNIVTAHIVYRHPYVNDPSEWLSSHRNAMKQFQDFTEHCYIQYNVPLFLKNTLLNHNFLNGRWLIKCGRGISIRKLDKMPVNLTKKMAHSFYEVPHNLCLQEGIRWAQIKGLGGSPELAYRLAKTRIGRDGFRQEVFWEKIFIWLTHNEKDILHHVTELIDYFIIKNQENVYYSVAGRKSNKVIEQCLEWHDQARYLSRKTWFAWARSGIGEFSKKDTLDNCSVNYVIKELLCSKDLFRESQLMKHCVNMYDQNCKNKSSAIFSLRAIFNDGSEKISATIEVSPKTKEIVQAKAKCNEKISETADTLMRLWAEAEGLTICNYL